MAKENQTVLFIVNPTAGHGKCGKKWRALFQKIDGKYDYEVFYTKERGQAEEEARNAVRRGIKRIFAVGGDGTVNEVINGAGESDVEIGIIPFGTGNDLAKTIQLPRNKTTIEKMALNPESLLVKVIDLGKINNRHFAIACGIGFDGMVAKKANDSRFLKKLGALGYLVSVMATLRSFKPLLMDVYVDGTHTQIQNGWLLAVGNGPYYGGGMKICPDAKIDDGVLELCVVSGLTKWQLFRFMPKVYSGSHVHLKDYVTFLRGKEISIHCHGDAVAHADGEILTTSDLTINLDHKNLKLLTLS
ncbi:MAG: diacylglycerol/lipid kinase family protein [Tuberibacillus sp.]